MKPVRPDSTQPAMNASVRNSPDCANVRPDDAFGPTPGSGFDDLGRRDEHDDRRAGSRMTAIVLNCRRR